MRRKKKRRREEGDYDVDDDVDDLLYCIVI